MYIWAISRYKISNQKSETDTGAKWKENCARQREENWVYSVSNSSHSVHCLSEIHAKVTIFRVGSRARTFCMFYSVFHHITHKSLPPITWRGTDRICFQEILQRYQLKKVVVHWLESCFEYGYYGIEWHCRL